MRVKVVEKEVLDPLAEIKTIRENINKIPDDFNIVSIINNTKPGADIVLSVVAETLGKRNFINVKKPAGAPATPQQLEKAGNGELAVLALGDCGSCSSWVILDAIRLEKMGVPTLSICSTKFSKFAHELARSHGAEDLRILSVKHPIAGISEDEIREKTMEILPSLRYILQIP
jgi:hypothetical protein